MLLCLRITLFISFVFFFSFCADTNLGNNVNIGSVGEPPFVPGKTFIASLESQEDFLLGTLEQLNAQPSGGLSLVREIIGETGRLVIDNEINFIAATSVDFRNTYSSPVVLAYIPTRNNAESLDVRVESVSATGMKIFIEDPDGDGIASSETVTYLVLESGRHEFDSGLVIEAGKITTTTDHQSPNAFAGDVVTFSQNFLATPVVLHTLNSYNNGAFKSSVCDSVSNIQMTLSQESAQTGTPTQSEEIAWAAFSQGTGSLIDMDYALLKANNGLNQGVDNASQEISYNGFLVAPDIVVKGSSGGGADGYWTRGAGLWNSTDHEAFSEEDQIVDAERAHANETFNVAAFSPNSEIGAYVEQGSFESQIYDLSKVKYASSSNIQWNTEFVPVTNVIVETNLSLDGGASWTGYRFATSGAAIPTLQPGDDLAQGLLKVRVRLFSSDEQKTPLLESLHIEVRAAEKPPE